MDNALSKLGIIQLNKNYFDTLLCKGPCYNIKKIAEINEVNFNYIDEEKFSISINENTCENDIQLIIDIISKAVDKKTVEFKIHENESKIPNKYKRDSSFLNDKIFNIHHSETSLMRYIKSLERKDLSLTHSMISGFLHNETKCRLRNDST